MSHLKLFKIRVSFFNHSRETSLFSVIIIINDTPMITLNKVTVSSSLCHRPRNCNLSNLCGRCKSLAPEIVSWFLGLCYSRKDFCRAPIDLHS